MPFITRCPYCPCRVRVPDRALGESLKCPSCQSWYSVAPESNPEPEPRTLVSLQDVVPSVASLPAPDHATAVAAAPTNAPASSTAAATPLVTLTIVTSDAPPPGDDASPTGWSPHPVGLVSCTFGGAALIAAQWPSTLLLTRPLSAIGLALGLFAVIHALGGRPIRQLFPVIGLSLSSLTLAVALLFPGFLGSRYEASRQRTDYNANALRVVPLRLTAGTSEGLETDGWVDASRAAVQQGTMRVQITGATLGPVQVVDSKKRYTRKQYLSVGVLLQHLGHGPPVRFVHWGTTGERTVASAIATRDERPLTPAQLHPDVAVGLTNAHELFPGKLIDDVLVFEPAGSGPVLVELPADAWGGTGLFRFKIPAAMITQNSR